MSLLKLAQSTVSQRLPSPGVARGTIHVTSEIKDSAKGTQWVNLEFRGQGAYAKSKVLANLWLTSMGTDGVLQWNGYAMRNIAAILSANGVDPATTILGVEPTPEINDTSLNKMLDLIDGQAAVVKIGLERGRNGQPGKYDTVVAFLDPTQTGSFGDGPLITKLGSEDAVLLDGAAAPRAARTTPATSAAPTRPAADMEF